MTNHSDHPDHPDEAVLSAWVTIQGQERWYGCGTEEELLTCLESHREEAADHNQPGVKTIRFTPATVAEIDKFRGETGDDWGQNLRFEQPYFYFK